MAQNVKSEATKDLFSKLRLALQKGVQQNVEQRKMQIAEDDPFKKLFVTKEHEKRFEDLNNSKSGLGGHHKSKSLAQSPKNSSMLILPEI